MGTLKERLADLLLEKGLNQKQLSEALHVNASTVSGYLTGNKNPGSKMQKVIAELFGVSVDYLMGYTYERYTLQADNGQKMINHLDIGLNEFVNNPSNKELIKLTHDMKEKGFDIKDLIEHFEVLTPADLPGCTCLIKKIKRKGINPDLIKGFSLKDIEV